MRAAVIEELAGEPIIRDVPVPEPASGERLVEITTAALNPADLVYAAGIRLQPSFPYVLGLEGIGHLEDGSRVYVPMARAPHGTFAEYCIANSVIPVPEAVADAQALGVGIAGTTGWLCLMWKGALKPGESVLVMGATGAVGQVVVQAAAALGASKVVAVGRDRDTLAGLLERGATDIIELSGDYASSLIDAAEGGFDLVVDSLFGEPLMAAIQATRMGGRIVNLGMRAGRSMDLNGIALKGKDLLSCDISHAPAAQISDAFAHLVELVQQGRITTNHSAVPLENVAEVWRRQPSSPHQKLLVAM
ncbi:MAG TPA: zinc-binding alcohol dehydrogenase family protein [Mycobacterium sp.]|nr:zinc-binding alcohol dehydrogenase family protein [Mycobacterium sp.]